MLSEEEKEAIEQLKSWRKYIINHRDSVNKANDIEFYLRTALNLIEKQQKELEKKDKVINEMAKDLMQFVKEPVLLPNEIIKEYIKKVECNEDIN